MRRSVVDDVDLHDPTIGTDQIRDPARISRIGGIIDAIRCTDRVVDIAQQLERPLILFRERTIRSDGVVAGAEHDDVLRFELADSITESVALERSTRGVRFWIEPEQHVRARELAQANASAIVRRNVEVRCDGASGEERHDASVLRFTTRRTGRHWEAVCVTGSSSWIHSSWAWADSWVGLPLAGSHVK